jgi:hypothetical protein
LTKLEQAFPARRNLVGVDFASMISIVRLYASTLDDYDVSVPSSRKPDRFNVTHRKINIERNVEDMQECPATLYPAFEERFRNALLSTFREAELGP